MFAALIALSFGQSARFDPVLTDSEKRALGYLYEEEKLARDVYATLWEKWAVAPFSNTKKAEAEHMAMIEQVFVDYKLPLPLGDDAGTRGRFSIPELQTLYDQLCERGSISRTDALMVGALIEEQDIADILAFRQKTNNKDLLNVYGCLQNASENHLRAFVRQLERVNIAYTPVVLESARYADILAERTQPGACRVPGSGKACKIPE